MTKLTEITDVDPALMDLFYQLTHEGETTDGMENWPDRGLEALLVDTQSGARYLIEPRPDLPSLVTRFAEKGPLVDYDGPRLNTVIIRHEGNPDRVLGAGQLMNVLGLSRKGAEFDPDSIYTTTPVTQIRYLSQP